MAVAGIVGGVAVSSRISIIFIHCIYGENGFYRIKKILRKKFGEVLELLGLNILLCEYTK